MHPEVVGYLLRAPAELRPRLEDLRREIVAAFPEAREGFDHFPVYSRGGTWLAGFAVRGRGARFFLMDRATLDAYAERLGALRTGRCSVAYRADAERTLAETRALVRELLRASARARSAHGV